MQHPGRFFRSILALLIAGGMLAAADPAAAFEPGAVRAIQAAHEIPEEQLLDVGIRILDPGLPAGDENALEEEGIFADVRRSEARFLPVRLMETLQETGHWGAVRVVPTATDAVDVLISGEIVESNGMKLVLELRAVDAKGREWLDDKYKGEADERSYRDDEIGPRDPFQAVYVEVANDLLAARRKLAPEELRELRTISRLQFAADLLPDAYGGYLGRDRKGRVEVVRLPAEDDPMMARIAQIRERDYMLVDTLNEYYAGFEAQMVEPYDQWRRYSYDELEAKRELKRAARTRKIVGALAILGAVLADGNDRATSAARDVAMVGGVAAIKSGIDKSKEAKIHIEALKELAASFNAEVAPVLVDVEGQTLRLTGSAETQYESWRQMLRQIFVEETGLPLDPNVDAPLPAAN